MNTFSPVVVLNFPYNCTAVQDASTKPPFHPPSHSNQTWTVVWWLSQPILDPTRFPSQMFSIINFFHILSRLGICFLEVPDLSIDCWPNMWWLTEWHLGLPYAVILVLVLQQIFTCSDPRPFSHSSLDYVVAFWEEGVLHTASIWIMSLL